MRKRENEVFVPHLGRLAGPLHLVACGQRSACDHLLCRRVHHIEELVALRLHELPVDEEGMGLRCGRAGGVEELRGRREGGRGRREKREGERKRRRGRRKKK